jgi:hypothetical protein
MVGLQGPGPVRKARRGGPADAGAVRDLDQARILRALAQRERYRYVQPRVEPEGEGWKVVSPNCSRNIDASGGDIDIAWLRRADDGRWTLHARDHARQCWAARASGLCLADALARLCTDPQREYWP